MRNIGLFLFFISASCSAGLNIINDTQDGYSQLFPVSAYYKICKIVPNDKIIPNCIKSGETAILYYGGSYEITDHIPPKYEVVIESISVYEERYRKLKYTQPVQTLQSPNLCASNSSTIHIGAFIPGNLVACNNSLYP